ncbi:exonuclease domain-containing protein [Aequorivita sp. SDUM287046]|uniref:Exonuclease domain-containing protein n=1 Tax=Aequorivita aurantiaca TaxID=3053356 RepID=A0ABT8DEW7_9FLAO|nr:exonuclease domain-containing protein [Aequorivita aurantiaca]MDN3723872.1 exonuclease domain-containing protein [Aequorivita aurantiaca]
MYAILDIETTGGKYNEEGITEIAIYKFDGHDIVDQFSSLINPEKPIQPFVVNLTGINNDMLRHAPKFYEVAKRIIEITEGCIIVAHNALFDNRILSTEFDRLGYNYEMESLCTVELAKKLIPDMPSYSLGKLVRSLGIPLSDRHRAQGDAKATLALFKVLLAKDTSKEIIKETLRKDPKRQLEPKLFDIIENAPSETGVYYMYNEAGTVIYIGKSKNIRKRLMQHFTNDNRRSKRLQSQVTSVSYEKTGSELIALLKEAEEIKHNKPLFNKGFRQIPYTHQLSTFVDNYGYINLKLEKADGRKKAIMTFNNYQQAKTALFNITGENQLCQTLTGLSEPDKECFGLKLNDCYGACCGKESVAEYNNRVNAFLEKNSFENQNLLIIDRGRVIDERSAIYIENGIFMGFGFYNLNYQINNPEILKSIIIPMCDSRNAQHIIQNYMQRKKGLKIVNLSANSVK